MTVNKQEVTKVSPLHKIVENQKCVQMSSIKVGSQVFPLCILLLLRLCDGKSMCVSTG